MITVKGQEQLAAAKAQLHRSDSISTTSIILQARRRDRCGYLDGMKDIRRTNEGHKWHSFYDDEADQIVLEPKFFEESYATQLHIFLHEAGHRGQSIDPSTYAAFKHQHLNTLEDFKAIANKEHLTEFERTGRVDDGLASEVFAESYSRAMLDLPLPAPLADFWQGVVVHHKAVA